MRPSYVELPLLDAPSTPRAALYRYLEGHRLPQGRVAAPGPCSLAVLFVLGNASHEQVRSIASVTLRSPRGDDLHFYARAVGAVHTAMDGADLLDQAAHVERALRTLAQLYRDTPAQLALLAHSMGGIAALHALGPLQAAASGGGGGGLGMAAAASAWRSRRSCASARRPAGRRSARRAPWRPCTPRRAASGARRRRPTRHRPSCRCVAGGPTGRSLRRCAACAASCPTPRTRSAQTRRASTACGRRSSISRCCGATSSCAR